MKEKPKQLTLEESAEKWVFETNGYKWSNNDGTAGDNYGSFIEGAKYMSEKMYSEEEVFSIIDKAFHMYASSHRHDAKEWFEQFKKK
jgi:hypothetical protein